MTRLIVGLGNPGKKYVGTRHNAGFEVAEILALRHNADFGAHARIPALVAEWRSGGLKWIVLKPVTFMNLSGQAVAGALNYWKIDISDLLVVVDDVDVAFGGIRVRPHGSAGGHNGLKSIIEHLGCREFARLRLGIGKPPSAPQIPLEEWVLQSFQKSELPSIEETFKRAVCAIEDWALEGPVIAMNRYNTAAPSSSDQGPSEKID